MIEIQIDLFILFEWSPDDRKILKYIKQIRFPIRYMHTAADVWHIYEIIKNAHRLGIKYVNFYKKIYIN